MTNFLLALNLCRFRLYLSQVATGETPVPNIHRIIQLRYSICRIGCDLICYLGFLCGSCLIAMTISIIWTLTVSILCHALVTIRLFSKFSPQLFAFCLFHILDCVKWVPSLFPLQPLESQYVIAY